MLIYTLKQNILLVLLEKLKIYIIFIKDYYGLNKIKAINWYPEDERNCRCLSFC